MYLYTVTTKIANDFFSDIVRIPNVFLMNKNIGKYNYFYIEKKIYWFLIKFTYHDIIYSVYILFNFLFLTFFLDRYFITNAKL